MRKNNTSPAGATALLVLFLFAPLWADSKSVLIDSTTAPGKPSKAASTGPKVWAIMRPLQCLGNPWEQDWVAHHKKSAVYPQREEKKIITDFFGRQQIHVFSIRLRSYEGGALCQTCDCPRGDTLYLLVDAEDAPLLKTFGFDKILPAQK